MNAEIFGMIITDISDMLSSTLDMVKDISPSSDPFYIASLVPESIMFLKMETIADLIFLKKDDKSLEYQV